MKIVPKVLTEEERIKAVCRLGRYQTLPFVCVATGAQPSAVVKVVLDNNWLGVCGGLNAVVVVTHGGRTNSCASAADHIAYLQGTGGKYLGIVEEHIEWFLTQYTADLLLEGKESKGYSNWGRLDQWEETRIRQVLGLGYPKRVLGLDSKLKIMYGAR